MTRASWAGLLLGLWSTACSHSTPGPVAPTASRVKTLAASESPAAAHEVSEVRAGDFRIVVRATELGNLAYELDCLADLISCTRDAIKPFWKSDWQAEDDAALATWKRIRARYSVSTPPADEPMFAFIPFPQTQIDFDERLRIAALLSETVDDFHRELRVLLPPQDLEPLVTAAAHFWPRFHPWWQSTGAAVGAHFETGLIALFEHGPLGDVLNRVARFYAAPIPPGMAIDFDLIVLPVKSKNSHGQQLLSHGVVEILPDEAPATRMDVVCHELFHFLYNLRTKEQQAALAAQFAATADPIASIAYLLVNEAVATALGNGVVTKAINPGDYEDNLHNEGGLYNDHAIDATAKGLLARTHGDPSSSRLDDPAIVLDLLAATRDAVGTDPRPAEFLRAYPLGIERGWDGVGDVLASRVNSGSVWTRSPFDAAVVVQQVRAEPVVSAVIAVPRAELSRLHAFDGLVSAASQRVIAAAAKTNHAFAYIEKRSPQARLFILVADKPTELTPVIEKLFAEPHAVLGLYVPAR